MKKIHNIFKIVLLLFYGFYFSQSTGSSVSNPMDNINQMYPASPTVNNLMKFEETPTNNYTGIPDIKIPITSLSTKSPSVKVNVSLNYHPNTAKPEDKSSEVGLGWSLFAGGSISRTVMNGPDGDVVIPNLHQIPKTGIYYDEFSPGSQTNLTRKFLDSLETEGVYVPIVKSPTYNSFLNFAYKACYLNLFDTEYDLYQYNFMGYSGRFIIKKNSSNQLYVQKLDENNLKIEISSLNPNKTYDVSRFTIIDEFGNKYIFNVTEDSKITSYSHRIGFNGYISDNMYNIGAVTSAFHLGEVQDVLGDTLIKFNYYPLSPVFFTTNSSITRNSSTLIENSYTYPHNFGNVIPAAQEFSTNSINTQTRLLKDIEIVGRGKINLSYLQSRIDTNYSNPNQLNKLDYIQILSPAGNIMDTYKFNYSNFSFDLHNMQEYRLKLDNISVFDALQQKKYDYQLNYTSNIPLSSSKLNIDHWGWFNCIKPTDNTLLSRNPSPACMKYNILESIKLPTGGIQKYDFESNTYSFIGSEPADIYDNPDNWDANSYMTTHSGSQQNVKNYFFSLSGVRQMEISFPDLEDNYNIRNNTWTFSIYKKVGNVYNLITIIGPTVDPDPDYPAYHLRNLEAGDYYTTFQVISNTSYVNYGQIKILAEFKEKKSTNLIQYVNGGGIRIKNISYYTDENISVPAKSINFDYNNIENGQEISGALIYPKPLHNYFYEYSNIFTGSAGSLGFDKAYTILSSDNFIPVQKTQGADVGYKNVSVSELNKGKTVYTYTYPEDTPNAIFPSSFAPPFISYPNFDFKRGLLVKERKVDVFNNDLSISDNVHQLRSVYKYTGIKFQYPDSPYKEFTTAGAFMSYEHYRQICTSGGIPGPNCNFYQDPKIFVSLEVVGKANMTNSVSKDYNNGSYIQTVNNILFNARDLPIKKETILPSQEINETLYSYAHEKGNTRLINANIIGIPLETSIIKKQNITDPGKVLSKIETKYDNPSNLFPSSVLSYDFNNVAQTEVTYDQYDSKGNLVQYTTKDGIPTAIIWGYNSAQPIAKVTGVPYSVAGSLAAEIITASDADINATTEQTLIDKLDVFRKQSAFLNAQVTTYTYDPLIGVTSITPPSGIREVYKYDSANRLESIKDINGKLLKEFKYNYKH
ncbi:hypothetical protein [Chryseobacterium turcicum]|uniref:YD repeat-containing protein n=1 Tax=Chryseobacterium turcicum TaxID=2898076 RepID=A0A9Q3V533_9FLAO|nr:hypothetical protein [Chryseobacterium turcicum]MCD1117455.1 hypothetical protein [Chryseobacterium turcicum]